MAQTYFNIICYIEMATVPGEDTMETQWEDTDFVTMLKTHLDAQEALTYLKRIPGIDHEDIECAAETLRVYEEGAKE